MSVFVAVATRFSGSAVVNERLAPGTTSSAWPGSDCKRPDRRAGTAQ
jgi:hypothetical protein